MYVYIYVSNINKGKFFSFNLFKIILKSKVIEKCRCKIALNLKKIVNII